MIVVYTLFDDVGHLYFHSNLIFFLFYREKVDSTQNDKKQKASKGNLSLARRSLCLGGLVHGEDFNNTNDQLPDISHDDDHVQAVIDEELVYSILESGL